IKVIKSLIEQFTGK
ncbi:alpha-1/alpha-2 family phenol-soluble modulin, partial [Staphylococcus aureus]|nr:alpha-1/alpha-2 family phenol-soluble modulin [Staphylococcus aureus]